MTFGRQKRKIQEASKDRIIIPKHLKMRGRRRNFILFVGKGRVFSPHPVRNLHYKYYSSSFRISRSELWHFKRKATLELREKIYLLL